tara:strand:+ start:284 stop:946 length:663 start_codon:yes stop_codon:yes gene_type:complete
MPSYLIDLAKLQASDEKNLKIQTTQVISQHPDLEYLLKLMHSMRDEIFNIHQIISNYNFDHLFELIISSVIEKKISGNYLKKCDVKHAIKIEDYNRFLRPKGISTAPRTRLLFCYLIFSSIDKFGESKLNKLSDDLVNNVHRYLPFLNTNILEADWMLLLTSMLHEAIGEKNLKNYLSSGLQISHILKRLDQSTSNQIIESLINYACSIDEEHTFYQDFI